MNFKTLLLVSAILSSATFVLLVLVPTSIPGAFGIQLSPKQYLLSYLIGGGDLAIAYLSLAGRRIKEVSTIRILAWYLILFHAQFGLLSIYSLAQDNELNLGGNIAFRAIVVAMFYYFGIYKNKKSETHFK